MSKADLHIHSTISDGSLTQEECIKQAKNNNIQTIALTEHDTTLDYEKAVELGAKYGVKIIPAIEISAFDKTTGKKAHILGYNYKKPEILENLCRPLLEKRNANSLKQIKILQDLGFEITPEKLNRGKLPIYKQHIMRHLVNTGQAEDIYGEFYYKYFKNNGPCQIDIDYIDVKDAVKAIAKAGGTPVLAHPLQQDNLYLVEELAKLGLKGIELNHPANKEERKHEILELAEKYNLILTGGSDYHGKFDNIKNNTIGSQTSKTTL